MNNVSTFVEDFPFRNSDSFNIDESDMFYSENSSYSKCNFKLEMFSDSVIIVITRLPSTTLLYKWGWNIIWLYFLAKSFVWFMTFTAIWETTIEETTIILGDLYLIHSIEDITFIWNNPQLLKLYLSEFCKSSLYNIVSTQTQPKAQFNRVWG